MRAPLILLAAAVVFSPAYAEDRQLSGSRSTVAVLMDFDEHYSPVTVTAMEQELESIMRACSLDIQWRVLDDFSSQETFNNLVVARFRGKCTGDVPEPFGTHPATLGLTHLSEGEILPFSEVNCDRVRDFVQPKLARENRLRVNQLLGRALGRVLAHELYHMLAKTGVHGHTGVAKPLLTPDDLIRGQLRLEDAQSEGIRRGLHLAGMPAIASASAAR